jgi:hypothetical protein
MQLNQTAAEEAVWDEVVDPEGGEGDYLPAYAALLLAMARQRLRRPDQAEGRAAQ